MSFCEWRTFCMTRMKSIRNVNANTENFIILGVEFIERKIPLRNYAGYVELQKKLICPMHSVYFNEGAFVKLKLLFIFRCPFYDSIKRK